MISYKQIKWVFRGNSRFFVFKRFVLYCIHIVQILVSSLYQFYKATPLRSRLNIHGMHFLTAALEQNQGVIMVCAHTGNWEHCANHAALHLREKRIVCNYIRKKPRQAFLETMAFTTAEKFGINIIKHDATLLRNVMRGLQQNQLIFFVMDQNPKQQLQAIKTHFFGCSYPTYRSFGKLAIKTQAPILLVYPYKNAVWGTHHVTIQPVCQSDTAEQLTQNVMTMLENHILCYPAQWIWSYPWKNYESLP